MSPVVHNTRFLDPHAAVIALAIIRRTISLEPRDDVLIFNALRHLNKPLSTGTLNQRNVFRSSSFKNLSSSCVGGHGAAELPDSFILTRDQTGAQPAQGRDGVSRSEPFESGRQVHEKRRGARRFAAV